MLSVIIPAYNEKENIERTAKTVSKILEEEKISFELVFISDGSMDGTYEEICRLAALDGRVRGAEFSRNFGKEAAIFAGLELSAGDACIVITRVLMQVHVAREETKFGFWPDELLEYFRARKFETLKATHICGVMGMASNTDDMERVRADFRAIADVFRAIRDDSALALRGFDTLSMGMSGDWPVAVEEGASLVRVGTRIFGPRQY